MSETYAELKILRMEFGFSFAEMAGVMGLNKATYQGYETNRRPMPVGFVGLVREWRRKDLELTEGIGERVDAQLRLDGFVAGIPSGA